MRLFDRLFGSVSVLAPTAPYVPPKCDRPGCTNDVQSSFGLNGEDGAQFVADRCEEHGFTRAELIELERLFRERHSSRRKVFLP